jgi:hypothetical protein
MRLIIFAANELPTYAGGPEVVAFELNIDVCVRVSAVGLFGLQCAAVASCNFESTEPAVVSS